MKRTIMSIMVLFLLLLTTGMLRAQVDKGVTSIGNEVDCTTINPSVDQTVNQYGEIVTKPSLTRNGMLITADCCPILLDGNLTDTVTCVSISMAAIITDGTVNTAVLQVFSDANRTDQVGSDIETTVVDSLITAQALNLACHTRYYFRLKLNGLCNYDWTDSTRDLTMGKATFCMVANARTTKFSATDSSREHKYNGLDTQIDSVYDHQGNAYGVVQIGNQCWLKSNMRCTTSPNGVLTQGTAPTTDVLNPRCYNYEVGMPLTLRERGLLYNWAGAMDSTFVSSSLPAAKDFPNHRGICPAGWHLPTDNEWNIMENAVVPSASDINVSNAGVQGASTDLSAMLSAGCYWNGNNNDDRTPNSYSNPNRNSAGFSVLPTGHYNGTFNDVGLGDDFWSATSCTPTSTGASGAWTRNLDYNMAGVARSNLGKFNAFSVRCVRDIECDFVPATSCTVPAARQLDATADLSEEHLIPGTNQIDSVYDHQGNAYGVVQIGNQCWLKENMRCTTSPNGILQSGSGDYVHSPRYYQPGEASVSQCGYLYNWAGAMDVADGSAVTSLLANHRGICPAGWHVPDTTEWINLGISLVGTSISNHSSSGTNYYADNTPIAAILAGSCDWNTPAANATNKPGDYSNSERNSSGFGLYPSPNYYNWSVGTFSSVGRSCYLWTANSLSETKAARFVLHCEQTGIGIGGADDGSTPHKQAGRNVRCVRDCLIPEISVCEDTTFGKLTLTTLTNTAKVDFYQGSTLKKTDNAPTQGKVYSDLPQGTYSVIATSSSGHTDTVTAYVKHTYTHCTGTPQAGTTLANGKLANNEWGSSVTHQIDSVSDHEGNVYEVVQINGQCWLKQNMRATTEPSGTLILQNPATTASFTDRIAYAVDNNLDSIPVYGLLYNWPAAVDTTASTTKVISFVGNRRGICPQGWHLPSASEYQGLFSFLAVGVGSGSGVTKLVSGCGWNSASGETPGNPSTETNVSGLSFVPTGFYSGGFSSVGELTSLWTTTNNVKNSSAYAVNFNSSYLTGWSTDNNAGRSVRCVRNTPVPANISFNANGGTATMEAMTVTTMNDTVLNANTFTHSGNAEFAGWSTDQCSSDIAFEDESQIYPLDDVSLYAQWNSFCTVNSVRAQTGTDQSHENGYKGNNTQIDSVYDHEGNAYGVTQIGGLCWMKENMRAISSPSGKEITLGAKNAVDDVLHYYKSTNVNSADVNYELYGCLYNWAALMDTTSGNVLYSMKDVRRGICPDGWHVPGETEWSDLEKQIANTTLAASDLTRTTSSTKLDAGRLAAGCNWGTVKTGLTYPACYNETERNSTLFSALPGGFKTYASSGTKDFTGVNTNAYFWSATEKDNDEAYVRGLVGGTAGVSRTTMNKYQRAVSVRCVRDIPYVFSNMETTEVTCSSVHFAAKMSEGIVSYNTTVLLSTQSDFSDTVAISTMVVSADSMISADFYDLKTNTTYYIKVAQNTTNFTTQLCACDVASVNTGNERALNGAVYEVQDVDGNWYGVVQIGDQCWTRQNMLCTTSPTSGTRIVANNAYYSSISKSAKWYANDSTNYASYGLLYNACAALDMTQPTATTELPTGNSTTTWTYIAPAGFVQGICPAGWHVPSDAEWTTMENYVVTDNHYGVSSTPNPAFGTQSSASYPEGKNTSISPMLAYPICWPTTVGTANATASDNAYRNITQFDAKASGYFPNSNTAAGANSYTYYWTSTPNTTNMITRQIKDATVGVIRIFMAKHNDLSVRCVRDIPYVFSNMETTKVTCSSVHFAAKMSQGIVGYGPNVLLSTQSDFSDTVAISTMVVSADSMISADFYDLKTNTTYYIKVAQNTTNFTTQLCACDVASVNTGNERALNGAVYEVQDVDGNWYGVVQIGDQCWTRQNMRCTTSPTSGTRIVANNNYYSSICKSARWYVNDSTNYASYGLLYNACAALDTTRPTASTELPTANSEATWTYTAPAGFVQGICPVGWHVPSDAEWTTMENYVVTDNHYGVSSNTEFGTSSNATFPSDNAREGLATSVSPMLAYPTSWTSVTTSNATASANEYRNVTQFDAKASGYCLKTSTPAGIGTHAAYWTSTPNGTNMFLRQMHNTTAGIGRLYTAKYNDLSVRCVRDVPTLTVTSDKTTANICVGEVASVTYTATLSCATTSSYTWSTGDVTSTNTLTVPYTSTGTYTVSCTAVGLQSNSVSVTIKNGAVGKFGVCEDLISGTAQVVDQGNCNSFVWKNASDVTVKTGITISVSETIPEGVYTVVGSSSTACPASKTVTLGNYVSKPCHVSNRGGNESGSESGLVETVTDHQNNSYTVVEIGNQCWMRENLRCTQDLSGNNLIYSYNDNRFDAPRACYYNNESALGNTYGVLYNWKAVMNGASATTANPSNVRGLCPVGWHVPSKAEWQQLVTYTGANSQSGKLASGCDWVWEPQYGTVPTASPADYNFANRNNFGFSARPFGSAIYGGVWGLGGNAIFWSTTELSSPENQCLDISDYSSPQMVTLSSENNAYFFLLNNTSSAVYYANPNNMITPNLTYTQKDNAYYVRCVRDN